MATLTWQTNTGYSNDFILAGGAGIGFRYTSPRGFELGFKAPLLVAALHTNAANTTSTLFGDAYLSALMHLPFVSVGYRF